MYNIDTDTNEYCIALGTILNTHAPLGSTYTTQYSVVT